MNQKKEKRETDFILSPFERIVLPKMARALPSWVLPDHLTFLGVIASIGIGLSYGFSGRSTIFLWLASLGLIVHWFGDSLDGTLARVRKTERPRYGFYLDHITDMFSTLVICLGLGFSPYLHFAIALGLVIGYYLLSINVYIETHVFGVFRLGYNRIGPTEVRVLLILSNTFLALNLPLQFTIRGITLGPLDLVGLGVTVGMGLMLSIRLISNLKTLAKMEPLKRK
jgi:phosphatidylglycerophosphate synthase